MKIINALKTRELNSQITCTSYYDFLTKERRCLKEFNCLGMQRDPPSIDPLGSAMDSARHYDVDDYATEWYLGTRALPVKNPRVCQSKFCSKFHPLRHARKRRLKATSYPVPGRRISPEFLSLLKQHHVRTQGHLLRKCRRPKTSFSYYKYDAEGKRRHMRPGIDTAAPLEFPNPMETDDPEYRKRLLREQRPEEEPHGHYSLSPGSKRIKNTRGIGNQDKNRNAKELKWLEVDTLEFPSTTQEATGNTNLETSLIDLDNKDTLQENIAPETYNHQSQTNKPSGPDQPHPPSLINFRDQLVKYICPSGQGVVPFGKNREAKDPRLINYVKKAIVKVIQSCSDGVSLQSESSKGNQCTIDGNNNNKEMFSPSGEEVFDDSVCKIQTQKTDVTNKQSRGILRNKPISKSSAFDSNFRKTKNVRIASCNYPSKNVTKQNRCGFKIDPKITGQKSRLAEGEHEKPKSSGNNSKRRLPRMGPSYTLEVACRQRLPQKENQNRQKKASKCSTHKELTETNKCGPTMNQEITRQEESRLAEGKHEKPNSSGNSPDISKRRLPCMGPSCTLEVACQHCRAKRRVPPKGDQNQLYIPQKETNKCSTQKEQIETNKCGPTMNQEITRQEESRLAEGKHEKPNSSGNSPDISKRRLPCMGPSCTQEVASQHCRAKPRVPPKGVFYFPQKETNKCSTQKEQIETNTCGPNINQKITGQEMSRLAERKQENPNSSPDNSEHLTSKGSSYTQTFDEPSFCNQSKWANPPNIRKKEKPKTNTETRSRPRSEVNQLVLRKEDQNHSEFRQEKTCQSPSQQDLIETKPYGSKVKPEIKGQEKSRLSERRNEKPNFGSRSPDNSETPLACKGTTCARTFVELSSGNYLKTNGSMWDNPLNSKKMEQPKMNTEVRHSGQSSKAKQQAPSKDDHNNWFFRQKITNRYSTQKEQKETSPYGSKLNTEIMRQESRLAVKEKEKPNFSGNSQDNSGRPLTCKKSSCARTVAEPSSGYHLKTNQTMWDNPSNSRKLVKPKTSSEIIGPRQQVPPQEDQHQSHFRQKRSSRYSTQKELTEIKTYGSKVNTEIMGQESRLAVRENEKPNFGGNSQDNSGRPLRGKGSSSTRTVAEPSYVCHLKNNQSTKKIGGNPCNCRKVKKRRVIPNSNRNRTKKRCPVKPPVTKTLVNNKQIRKSGTNCPRDSKAKESNCCPEAHCNLKRWPTKPIPIRCNPVTRKCVPFPHSSGNEKTDLKRWLYPSTYSGRRMKRYTKTRKTSCKGDRATKKCHQSDTSSSSEQSPSRVRNQQRARGESCLRCPCCSSVIPTRCSRCQEAQFTSASRGHENYQRCCAHSNRWHCKPKCQENSQGSCEQTNYTPKVFRQFTRYCGPRRMPGGVDLREDDNFIPGRNRGVSHSFSSSMSSDSDSNRQVKYTKPRKWSVHAFCFD